MTEEEYKEKIKKLREIKKDFLKEIEQIKTEYKKKIKDIAEEKRQEEINKKREDILNNN